MVKFTHLFFILLFPFLVQGKLDINPWEINLSDISDSVQPLHYWNNSTTAFTDEHDFIPPADLGNGSYLMVLRSAFHYDGAFQEPTIQISPTDHPYRVFVNGHKVLTYGITKENTVASNFRSELALISPEFLQSGNNTIIAILYPRGERSAPPTIAIDDYIPNTQRRFWQTFLNYTFTAGHSISAALICLLFISFWVSSHRERKDYFYFALTSLFIGLGYINVIFATPSHLEIPLWIIARTAFVAASATLLTFTTLHAGVEHKLKWINRTFLFATLIFFFNLLLLKNKYAIDLAFSTATSILITPALVLSIGTAIYKLRQTKSFADILIVLGIFSTFVAAFHDMYYFKNFKLPYFWTVAYGYAIMEVAIVIALAKDLWKLFLENREKADLLEQQNIALEKQKAQLEEVSSGKSRFLRNMSHEFKTPLQGMVAIAELLQKQDENRDTLQTILHALNIQMQKHLYNIQNVIDLSILEEQIPELNNHRFSKQQFTDSLELMFNNNEHNRSNTLNLTTTDSLPTLFYGDKEHISRITTNLLTNMVSDVITTGINCSISWDESESTLQIAMGNGIREINSRTLEILQKPQEDILIQYNDTNGIDDLAVFVAARLVPVLGASLSIRNNDGEIVLRFPVQKIVEEHAPYEGSGTILVAEDNPVNRMLIRKILEKLGYNVVTAEDGIQAVEQTLASSPSLIFMDVQMPNMNGIEATKAIREKIKDVIIVALTANANRSECINAGMNDFLNKPARMEELKTIVDHYLAS